MEVEKLDIRLLQETILGGKSCIEKLKRGF